MHVTAEEYEQVESGEAAIIVDPVGIVEVRQIDGLLALEVRPLSVESLSSAVTYQLGLPMGRPAIRVVLAHNEGEDDG